MRMRCSGVSLTPCLLELSYSLWYHAMFGQHEAATLCCLFCTGLQACAGLNQKAVQDTVNISNRPTVY